MIVEAVRAYDLVKTLNLGPCYRGGVCLPYQKVMYQKYVTLSTAHRQWMGVMLSDQIDLFLQESCNTLPVYSMKCRLL